jgi:hypothetical protein
MLEHGEIHSENQSRLENKRYSRWKDTRLLHSGKTHYLYKIQIIAVAKIQGNPISGVKKTVD